jgi:hypothetical protein
MVFTTFTEVENVGDTSAANIYVVVKIWSYLSGILEEADSRVMLDVLLPGRKAPFHYISEVEGSEIAGHTVEMGAFDTVDPKPLGLEIVSHSSSVVGDSPKIMMISGQVRNSADGTANEVKVLATFYNGTNFVVGVADPYTSPGTLNSGQTVDFVLTMDITGRESQFVSYALAAESSEYAQTTTVTPTPTPTAPPPPSPSPSPTPTPTTTPTPTPTPTSTPVPTPTGGELKIVSHIGRLDVAGYYHVDGEVQNTGETALRNMHLEVTLYDAQNAVLDEEGTFVMLGVLLPGRKAPFHYTAGMEGSKVSRHTVEIEYYDATDSIPLGLEIVSHSTEMVGAQNMKTLMVRGQVKNSGSKTASYVKLFATFYDGADGTGGVVGVSSATSQPYTLNVGQSGTFQIAIDVTNKESQFKSYILVAESEEYAIISPVSATLTSSSTPSPSPSPTSTPTPTPAPSPTSSPGQTPTPTPSPSPPPASGIPGFPYESIVLGLIIGAMMLWIFKKK